MNKITKIIAAATFALGLTACGTSKKESASTTDNSKLTVIATANPHAVILDEAKSILKDKYNIDLEVTITDDYFIPNEAVSNGEADAAYENGEGDLVAINGNFAINAGLKPGSDALILEKANESNPYVNIIACQEGHEKDEKIQALVKVLQSEEIREFIKKNWSDGSVIPAE